MQVFAASVPRRFAELRAGAGRQCGPVAVPAGAGSGVGAIGAMMRDWGVYRGAGPVTRGAPFTSTSTAT